MHIPYNRLIMQYLLQQTALSIMIITDLAVFLRHILYNQCMARHNILVSWQLLVGHDHLIVEASRSHSVGLLWTSDQPYSETSALQHATFNKRHPCPRRDSIPPSQQASGRRPAPYTPRPLWSALHGLWITWNLQMSNRQKKKGTWSLFAMDC